MAGLHPRHADGSAASLLLQATPTQRLLSQGVLALTGQIVRGCESGAPAAALRWLVAERHRLLRELGNSVTDDTAIGCLAAMTAAVIESDRALDVMLGA